VATRGRALPSEQREDSPNGYYKGGKAQRIPPSQLALSSAPVMSYWNRESDGNMQEAEYASLFRPTLAYTHVRVARALSRRSRRQGAADGASLIRPTRADGKMIRVAMLSQQ
jgi:hypothetical protein